MWMSDPSGGVSQSMLVGLGIWVAFAYLWTFSPVLGARRDVSVAYFGAGGVGGAVGARVFWWLSQGFEGGGLGAKGGLLTLINPWVPGYSSLGFLAGAGIVVAVMHGWGRVGGGSSRRVLDVVVLSGLLGLVFARLGCVFNGCDFGSVSGGANLFSIRYARGSLAWQRHYLDGLIGGEQAWSLPTHGFPLYSAAATFLVVVGVNVWAIRRDLAARPGGKAACIAVIAFCMAQFVLEFLRETPLTGSLSMQLNINQITLMGVLLITGALRMVHVARVLQRH